MSVTTANAGAAKNTIKNIADKFLKIFLALRQFTAPNGINGDVK